MDLAKLAEDKKYPIAEKKGIGYRIKHYKVDAYNEKAYKRIKGDYFVIDFDYISLFKQEKTIKKEVMKILKCFFKNETPPRPLIIGLGNSSIPCDSLGVNTTNKIMATNHFTDFLSIPKVALFNPEVTEKTGISSFSLIEMVVKKLKPTVIIMIDSLATTKEENLNNCLEINNTGIIPGKSLKDNKKIDSNTFNIPLISMGVPLVLDKNKHLYTSPNVNEIIDITSTIMANALNDLFF